MRIEINMLKPAQLVKHYNGHENSKQFWTLLVSA